MRSSLACWCLEAQAERPERLISADMLPSEVPTLGGMGNCSVLRGPIIIVSEISGTLA